MLIVLKIDVPDGSSKSVDRVAHCLLRASKRISQEDSLIDFAVSDQNGVPCGCCEVFEDGDEVAS